MNRNLNRSATFSILFVAALAAAAAPATPAAPASRPATTRATTRTTPPPPPPLTAKDSVELKSEKYKLSFRIPKTWEKVDATVSGGDAEIFVYGPPSPNAGHANANAAAAPTRQVQIVVGKPCTPGETIDDLAATMRTEYAADVGKPVTFTHDAAETVEGQPGWRLDYPFETSTSVTTTSRGKTNTHEVKVKNFKRIDFWIRDGSFCEAVFSYDTQSAAVMERAAEQIVGSFADTE